MVTDGRPTGQRIVWLNEIDEIVAGSLSDLIADIFSDGWIGRERELVSLFAFGYVAKRCRPGSFFHDPTQIGIEVAVPQIPGERRKPQVCKDLVIWPEPRMTCWDQDHRPVHYPAVIIEWKANRTKIDVRDVDWLQEYSGSRDEFLGYAVCVDLRARRFKLACDRVHCGQVQTLWMTQ